MTDRVGLSRRVGQMRCLFGFHLPAHTDFYNDAEWSKLRIVKCWRCHKLLDVLPMPLKPPRKLTAEKGAIEE